MYVLNTQPLFAWDCLEDSPSLKTIRALLRAVPDGGLLESLRQARGKGRNDYPVHVCWGVLLLRIALRHVFMEGCLAELKRNEGLRRLIDVPSEEQVPHAWNMSRFEELLGEEPHRTRLKQVFNGGPMFKPASLWHDLIKHTSHPNRKAGNAPRHFPACHFSLTPFGRSG